MDEGTRVMAAVCPQFLGRSRQMRDVLGQIRTAAGGRGTILLLGESGTGKQLAAQSIHSASARSSHPFMIINCAAYVPTLLESELFGHERGAFSGATETRVGRFEAANFGTVFIDEVGDLTIPVQLKLLRVLESFEIERVGSNRTIRVDVRVIAATNRDLEQLVAQGLFREDLYQRLHGIVIQLPPLRERGGDVRLIAESFLADLCDQIGRPVPRFTPEALAALDAHTWPGNIREMRNTIERIMNASDLVEITRDWVLQCLNKTLRRSRSEVEAEAETETGVTAGESGSDSSGDWRSTEKRMIQEALRAEEGRIGRAAERIGWSRFKLTRRIKKHGIKP